MSPPIGRTKKKKLTIQDRTFVLTHLYIPESNIRIGMSTSEIDRFIENVLDKKNSKIYIYKGRRILLMSDNVAIEEIKDNDTTSDIYGC